VRTATGLRADRLLEGLERSSLGTTRIAAITLFESRLSPTGPTYVPMLRTSLGGPT
jgi:2'-5' RNA ligase